MIDPIVFHRASKKSPKKMETVLLSAFVGLESAHAFSAFEPSVFTIQGLAVPQGQEHMIRKGYIPAIIFSGLLGGIVSALIKSKMPLAMGMITSGFMVCVYEVSIATAPKTTIQSTKNAMVKTKNGETFVYQTV